MKHVYFFGDGKAEGEGSMKSLLGGKGAGLAEMTNLGVSVPAGFTITTETCEEYYNIGKKLTDELKKEILENLNKLEKTMGMNLGDSEKPLLVSVRSGAAESMPGMMDTILNLGMNAKVAEGIIKKSGNERFAWDSYRRFIQMFGDVAMEVPRSGFEDILTQAKEERAKREGKSAETVLDTDLDPSEMKEVTSRFLEYYKNAESPFKPAGESFPEDPKEQMWKAVEAVFASWNNERALIYRRENNIKGLKGTAVNVQAMVFGNMGNSSATGVCFSRNPANGAREFYGEFLINAQGEDVVAGTRTPQKISIRESREWADSAGVSEEERKSRFPSLEELMPDAYKQLVDVKDRLEHHNKDMQDLEFTIQEERLYLLQTRNGKRTGFAAVNIAVDMVEEGFLSEDEAFVRINPESLNELLRPIFDAEDKKRATKEGKVIGSGLNAGPGAATGIAYFDSTRAAEAAARGEKVILVRKETSPEDIRGMMAAEGILTILGGATSHAAVVARQLGKVCVAGAGSTRVNEEERLLEGKGQKVKEGEPLSLDGFTGEVIAGEVKTKPSEVIQVVIEKSLKPDDSPLYHKFKVVIDWAARNARMLVRANADQPDQAQAALLFGADGIGLCRTEHMFFGGDRIDAVREMILAKPEDSEARIKALKKLLPMQREDFAEIFRVMAGKPVTVRLLDPPLHEFLPHEEDAQRKMASEMGITFEEVRSRVEQLSEFNPMLGHRGCRLAMTYPEIYDMQVNAIVEAADIVRNEGVQVEPEIMIPLVGEKTELSFLRSRAEAVIKENTEKSGRPFAGKIGTMIEVPRAALTADEIANEADFFSFGTNDLTQMTCGFSRDDTRNFMESYIETHGVYEKDPFQQLDQTGVGKLMGIAVKDGRETKPGLKMGVCGEHGGDPESVSFCETLGLDYVSCSPFRIPVARLAAAIATKRKK